MNLSAGMVTVTLKKFALASRQRQDASRVRSPASFEKINARDARWPHREDACATFSDADRSRNQSRCSRSLAAGSRPRAPRRKRRDRASADRFGENLHLRAALSFAERPGSL